MYVCICMYVCMYMYVCMSVILNPYEVVCDTAPVLETKMNSLLLDFEKSGALPEVLYYRIRSSAEKKPRFMDFQKSINQTTIILSAFWTCLA